MVMASFIMYGFLIGLAEVLIAFRYIEIGIMLHFASLGLLLTNTVLSYKSNAHQLYLALSLAPIYRILSLFVPALGLPVSYWCGLISIPLYGAAIIVTKVLSYQMNDVGINRNNLPRQFFIGLLGFPLGYVGFCILHPPSVAFLGVEEVLLLTIFLIFAGFTEELVFRGVMLSTALKIFNRHLAVVYISFIFAVMYIWTLSAYYIVFTVALSLLFSILFVWGRSVVGVALARGIYNLTVFIICPNILGILGGKLSTTVDKLQTTVITAITSGYQSQISNLPVISLIILLILAEICGAASDGVQADKNQYSLASKVIYVGVIPLLSIFAFMMVQKVLQ